MSQSTLDSRDSISSPPEPMHWTAMDTISTRNFSDMLCYPNFLSDRDSECNNSGWLTDFGDMFVPTCSPSPARSIELCQDRTLQYRSSSSRTDDDSAPDPAADNKEKRRVQNKKAQQAFRKRKDLKLHELESQVSELKADLRHIVSKYHELRSEHYRLHAGLTTLLNVNTTTHAGFADITATVERKLNV